MGGVCDLEWWSGKDGDCVPVACELQSAKVAVRASKNETGKKEIVLNGFSGQATILAVDDILNIEPVDCIGVGSFLAHAVAFAYRYLSANYNGIDLYSGGIDIQANPSAAKGLGGSSAVAACVFLAVLGLFTGNKTDAIPPHDLIRSVIGIEKNAGVGGGWEDIAGIILPGINKVSYRPGKSALPVSITPVVCGAGTMAALQDQLLLFDSMVPASTGMILNGAYSMYKQNPDMVICCTDSIRSECDIVIKALLSGDVAPIGGSLSRQRNEWDKITGGLGRSYEVDSILEGAGSHITGYREAGAGGGGTVTVVCKTGMTGLVRQALAEKGYSTIPWKVSDKGICVE